MTCVEQLDKVAKPTNGHRCIKVSYIIKIVVLLHVSPTLVAIIRKMHYTG